MSSLSTLLMLHGARGCTQEVLPFAHALTKVCILIGLNLLGHGGRSIPHSFSVGVMARDILAEMDSRNIKTAYLFGYSFGGYIALYLAKHAPERVLGVCTLATKVIFDQHTVDLYSRLSRVDRIRNQQAELMNRRHPGQNWEPLVSGLAELYKQLGQTPALTNADLASITVPALTISANKDQLVPWMESLKLAYQIPKGQGFTFAGLTCPH